LLAVGLAFLGETERAKQWAARALAIDPDDVMTKYNIACFHAVLGEVDRAFDLLEELIPRGNADMKAWVMNDSDFDVLHSHPRWQRVLEQVK
jgi:adenylate cyclase